MTDIVSVFVIPLYVVKAALTRSHMQAEKGAHSYQIYRITTNANFNYFFRFIIIFIFFYLLFI